MSFSITTPQMRAREKTVTRRWGWYDAQPGDVYMAVEKSQGIKKGEKIVRMYPIEVISAREEPLDAMLEPTYGAVEVRREGFPDMHVVDFVAMLRKIKPKHCTREHPMRIEFRDVKP